MNVKLLKKVKDEILKDPSSFDMSHWCGTPCYIAGHLFNLAGEQAPLTESFVAAGARLLGIDSWCADDLFYVHGWPIDLQKRYNDANARFLVESDGTSEWRAAQLEMAKAAADRIDRFIIECQP